MTRRMLAATLVAVTMALAACGKEPQTEEKSRVRIGVVAKSLGNGFFDAVNKGAQEAAQEIDAQIIFTGPTTPTAEGQIEVVNALIAQRVDAIAISANDPDALVPVLQRAMQRGIEVVSYDSAVAQPGRIAHLAPSSDELIGQTCAQLAGELALEARGKIAVISATPTSTNQNAWLAAMQAALPQYPGLQLVAVAYGDDVSDKSYREAVALTKQHPDLSVIVSLSSVGIVATAKAIEDQGLTGKVKVTGLGLPSELAGYVEKGVVPKFAIWNPIDLGYATTRVAAHLLRGEPAASPQGVSMGRLGTVNFDERGVGAMAKPFIYDGSNVQEFAKVF